MTAAVTVDAACRPGRPGALLVLLLGSTLTVMAGAVLSPVLAVIRDELGLSGSAQPGRRRAWQNAPAPNGSVLKSTKTTETGSACGHVGRRYRCFVCVVGQARDVQVAASADAGVLACAADATVRTRWLSGRCPAPRR